MLLSSWNLFFGRLIQGFKMSVKIALIQGIDQGSVEENLTYTIGKIKDASKSGAQIVCTQELFLSNYFCRNQTEEHFDLAEKIPGPTTIVLQDVAKENNIVIVASLFEEAIKGLYYNTSVVIDADGSYLGKYRKNHIPQDPYFEEKFYFAPGDTGYPVWDTQFGKIGVMICWDQWYPETARLLALKGAEIIFAPTAIGWLPEEKESKGKAQHHAWEHVQLGHAVANSCYFAAVNRVGTEEPIEFWGQSFVSDFYGQIMTKGDVIKEDILYADCDLKALTKHRQIWPFFRDRRTDTYQDLLKRHL